MAAPKQIADLQGRPLSELTTYLEASDYRLRADAACVIGDMVRDQVEKGLPDDTMAKLKLLLRDIEPTVRLEAAITLSLLGEMSAAPVLRELTQRRAIRLDAIYALGQMGDRESIPLLQGMLARFLLPWADKLQAAAALSQMGDSLGQDYLESRLKSRRYLEKAAACHFIGESHHPRSLTILTPLIRDEKSPIRDSAIRAAGQVDAFEMEELLAEIYYQVPLILQNDVVESLRKIALCRELGEKAKKILNTTSN